MEKLGEAIGMLFMALLALVTIIAFVGGILVMSFRFFSFSLSSFSFNLFGRDIFRYVEFFPGNITPAQEIILMKNFKYYEMLPYNLQNVFRSRLKKFMDIKKFETRKGLILTDEMKVLISASALQLTFGLKQYHLPDFKRIIIYPEKYYSQITRKYHKGEANARGLIVLSWKDFKEGYSESKDNLNVGLHEFAHALFISYNRNRTDDMSLLTYYDEWKKVGDEEFFKLRKGNKNYLRSYGGTNMMEFFSVCVEHFFETPVEFREKIPQLYNRLVKLLGQDPVLWLKK